MFSKSKSADANEVSKKWFVQFKEVCGVMRGTPRLLSLVWGANKLLCCGVVVLNLFLALIPLAEMQLTKAILDALTHPGQSAQSSHLPLLLLGLGSAISFIYFALEPSLNVCEETLADMLTRDVNIMLMKKANNIVDISLFETPDFYNKLETARREASHKPISILNQICSLMRFAVEDLSMLVVLLVYQPLIPLMILILCLPRCIEEVTNRKMQWSICNFEIPEIRFMSYFQHLLTSLYDAKEVRLFNLGDYFLKRYCVLFDRYFERHRKMRNRHWLYSLGLSSLTALGSAVAFIYVGLAVFAGAITVGAFSLYTSAIERFRFALQGFLHGLVSLYEANLFAGNLFQYLDIVPPMPLVPAEYAHKLPADGSCSIEFCNVAFSYPKAEKPVFTNLSFKIEAGQSVALVGENGAGKTTLVKLLSRLYDPTAGKILINGVDLREYDIHNWRENISVILQDFSRFYLSAGENIGIARLPLIENKPAMAAAASRGGASEMIASLSNGYDTLLGRIYAADEDGSVELSGGQWQKVALSRAFMRSLKNGDGAYVNGTGVSDAQLLILDEPTSALDAQAEYDVFTRFNQLTRDKTTFLISHRFSTVRMADLILVLEKGEIIERGSHEDLIRDDGEYARLFNLQADRYK